MATLNFHYYHTFTRQLSGTGRRRFLNGKQWDCQGTPRGPLKGTRMVLCDDTETSALTSSFVLAALLERERESDPVVEDGRDT